VKLADAGPAVRTRLVTAARTISTLLNEPQLGAMAG